MDNLMFYKAISRVYDLLDIIYFNNTNRNPRKALSNLVDNQDSKILDICTGTAANAIAVAKRNKASKIIGIDLSKEMLHIAKKKVMMNGLNNIKLLKMDASDTSFQDNTFDVIIMSLVLHEIPNELARKIIIEAKRILKPEGKLLVMDWEEPQSFFKKILFYPLRKLEPKGFEQFLQIDMKSYFEQFDLKISEIRHCDYTKVLNLKNANVINK
jgi:demethylmenaquinone methyltransferase/2-methoxy-6-polyprenyl-1,4-benzoquinol methylase